MSGKCLVAGMLVALGLALVPSSPARAEIEEPLVTTYAWYWEPQTQRSVTDPTSGADVVTAGPGNAHFCPGVEGAANPEQACKPGRLPVEVVGGDYKSPDKISATAFDLSIAPMGSEVNRFTVTYLEANDEQSQPFNAEGKRLQACPINKIFGGGEARQYKEAPRYECPDKPILGTRTKVKPAEEAPPVDRFQWTFDLTAPAQRWVKKGSFATGVMLLPVEPKNSGPSDANWRVVLQGSEDTKGVQTELDFVPARAPSPPAVIGGGDDPSGGLGPTGGDLGGGSLGTSLPDAGGDLDDASVVSEAESAPAKEGEPELASDDIPAVPGGLPGYVWLGLLAALIGFSAVRSVVFEGRGGVRPNGVLAQIHELNRQRRGRADAAADPGLLAPVIEGLSSLGARARSLAAKLPRGQRG